MFLLDLALRFYLAGYLFGRRRFDVMLNLSLSLQP